MPVYDYQAYDEKGHPRSGVIESETERRARQELAKDGLLVKSLTQSQSKKREGTQVEIKLPQFLRAKKQSQRITAFTRQLATLLGSGVALTDAIDLLVRQMPDIQMEKDLRELTQDIKSGSSFAEALEKREGAFSSLYVNMVRAGESSGTLGTVLLRLSQYLHQRRAVQSKVSAAFAYPGFIVLVALAMVVFMLLVPVPQMRDILLDMGRELPLPTEIVLGLSDLVVAWWPLVFAAGGLLIFGFLRLKSSPYFIRWWDEKCFALPVVGSVIQRSLLSRFTTTFSTLLRSGIPAMESLSIVSKVMDNSFVGEQISSAQKMVGDGFELSQAFERQSFFPPMITFMMSVGEKSGDLPELLEEMGSDIEEELEIDIQKMVSVLEPLIIVVVAVVVLIIIMSILLPMLEMSRSFG